MFYKLIPLVLLGVIALTFSAQVLAILKTMLICTLILAAAIGLTLALVFIALGIYTTLF